MGEAPLKPTIFFSHSSRDGVVLQHLKDLFVEKTGGTVEVFLSSDGQSIPFGRNWSSEIEAALGAARLAFTFVTSESVQSRWLFFESGHMYARGVKVIPIGFLAYDLTLAPSPISLLQGFNITSEKGLNNIIKVVNDEFNYRHKLSFDKDDFNSLLRIAESSGSNVAHLHSEHVVSTKIAIPNVKAKELMEKIQAIFAVERIEYFIGWDDIVIPGLLIVFENTTENLREVIAGKDCFAEGQTKRITVLADYEASGDGARILNKVYCIVRDTQVRDREAGKALSVRFDESIEMLTERHLIAGRLQRSAVKFDPTEWIVYEDMTASIYSDLSRSSSLEVAPRYVGQVNVGLNFTGDKVPLGELRAFVEVLFERKVLRKAIGFPT